MFRKNKKQTETIKEPKEKKVRTFKVGTHKKSVIALWVVLIASVSFGAYKNFTAIDQHTTHDPYISKCCLRPFYDKYGNVCIVVDMELKGRIREALIKMILDFDIPLETEE